MFTDNHSVSGHQVIMLGDKSERPVKEVERERGGKRWRLMEEELPQGYSSMDWWHRDDSEKAERMVEWKGQSMLKKVSLSYRDMHICVRTNTQ